MRILHSIALLLLLLHFPGCGKEKEPNRVDLDQFNVDESNDYRYIFRDMIEKDREEKKEKRKEEFR